MSWKDCVGYGYAKHERDTCWQCWLGTFKKGFKFVFFDDCTDGIIETCNNARLVKIMLNGAHCPKAIREEYMRRTKKSR